ncbi:MAG: tyrosine-type recombinase/integrase [Pseudomonadota bacterium]
MGRGPLTDTELRNLKPPAAGQREVPVGGLPGLCVRISKGGAKTFCLYYRLKGDRLRRRRTLGRYPEVTLKEARDLAYEVRTRLRNGEPVDTTPPPATNTTHRSKTSFASVVDDFCALHCAVKNKPGTALETRRQLDVDFVSRWGARQIRDITRRDVTDVLDAILERGSPSAANHALAAVRKLFAWSLRRGLVDMSPCFGLDMPSNHNSRDRFHTDDEIRCIWRALETEGYPYQQIVQLLLLTGQRRGEVAGMRWSEIDFDRALWTLPARRTKSNRAHEVPLSLQAVAILKAIPRRHGELVFVADDKPVPVSGFSKRKRRLDAVCAIPPWSLHDLRRTVATGMGRLGVDPHIVRRILNHSPRDIDGITAVYNRFAYLDQKRAALDTWAAHVESLVRKPK